jgi:hypothetical protein
VLAAYNVSVVMMNSSKAAELPTGASNGRTHQCGSGFVEICTVVQSEQTWYVNKLQVVSVFVQRDILYILLG